MAVQFGQRIWRKVQECGFAHSYATDPDFAMHIKMIVLLAFVPNRDKARAYDELINLDSFPHIQSLLNYFESTFICEQPRQRRRGGTVTLFPCEFQDCYSAL